jgi:tRNA (guanine-N7-)-methyltransferase
MKSASPAGAKRRRNDHARVEQGRRRAGEGDQLPQKKFFRQRAHINPLGSAAVYTYPVAPQRMAWARLFAPEAGAGAGAGEAAAAAAPDTADVGCGFGGLIIGLAPRLPPGSRVLGMEIRPKVTEYVRLRILALRRQATGAAGVAGAAGDAGADADASPAGSASVASTAAGGPANAAAAADPAAAGFHFRNAAVLKINAMKFLPNFFARGQLQRLFFCFPDPQFKPSHHRRRIVNTQLLDEYAFALREGALLYTITDVLDLHRWMAAHGEAHPSFERVVDGSAEIAADPCVAVMRVATEEGRKVERNGGDKHVAVFRRLPEADALAKARRLSFWEAPTVAYEYLPAPSQRAYAEAVGSTAGGAAWIARVAQEKAALQV